MSTLDAEIAVLAREAPHDPLARYRWRCALVRVGRGAEDAAIAAAGGLTFAERLAVRLEGRKVPPARVVQKTRSVRDGQLAAAGDVWGEGRGGSERSERA